MRIIEDIISDGHGWLSPSYVVIHETANPGATARNHRDYWSRDDTYAVHYVGDWTGDCYHCVPNDRLCWQVGNANDRVVGIELCHATNWEDFNAVWELGVEWAAMMLQEYGWGIDRLISHNDCTEWWGGSDHTDPIDYFEDFGRSWDQFKRDVADRMEDDVSAEQVWQYPLQGPNSSMSAGDRIVDIEKFLYSDEDPTGRDKKANFRDRIAWMAKKQEDQQEQLDGLEGKIDKILDLLDKKE